MTRASGSRGAGVRGVVLLALATAAPWAPVPLDAQGLGTPRPDPRLASPPPVDTLLAWGRLQEAAWALRDLGDTARADALLARLDSVLRSPPREARPQDIDHQGVSYTWRLRHGDGVQSVFKVDGSDIFCPECGADREVAVYRIDRLLGFDLTPVTVLTEVDDDGRTLRGSAMYFVPGATRPHEVGAAKPDRLRLFDAIIGNTDRHQNNWLLLDGGRVVAIDHNRAFEYTPTTRPKSCWETEIDALREPAGLGLPFERYRTLPADSLRAAAAGLDPARIDQFVAMRDRIVARVDARARNPRARLPTDHCEFDP